MPGLCSLQTRQGQRAGQECLRSLFRKLQETPTPTLAGAGSAGQPLGSVFFCRTLSLLVGWQVQGTQGPPEGRTRVWHGNSSPTPSPTVAPDTPVLLPLQES